jgi:hypothetical protein
MTLGVGGFERLRGDGETIICTARRLSPSSADIWTFERRARGADLPGASGNGIAATIKSIPLALAGQARSGRAPPVQQPLWARDSPPQAPEGSRALTAAHDRGELGDIGRGDSLRLAGDGAYSQALLGGCRAVSSAPGLLPSENAEASPRLCGR